ncbi:hypothetical protein GMRT_14078 [Giardia muris]|uniref:Uncharacterized protein n=1 Tax=Giardia muris TaxID=5742 RepID=A0A4Z1STT6_GIAMU|nr:hypothetical protein GMRT_14078 [Giardia muris]|eukprot:TNJ29284.1 hypothetical protein GMRT_14078 [Giardia muris]
MSEPPLKRDGLLALVRRAVTLPDWATRQAIDQFLTEAIKDDTLDVCDLLVKALGRTSTEAQVALLHQVVGRMLRTCPNAGTLQSKLELVLQLSQTRVNHQACLLWILERHTPTAIFRHLLSQGGTLPAVVKASRIFRLLLEVCLSFEEAIGLLVHRLSEAGVESQADLLIVSFLRQIGIVYPVSYSYLLVLECRDLRGSKLLAAPLRLAAWLASNASPNKTSLYISRLLSSLFAAIACHALEGDRVRAALTITRAVDSKCVLLSALQTSFIQSSQFGYADCILWVSGLELIAGDIGHNRVAAFVRPIVTNLHTMLLKSSIKLRDIVSLVEAITLLAGSLSLPKELEEAINVIIERVIELTSSTPAQSNQAVRVCQKLYALNRLATINGLIAAIDKYDDLMTKDSFVTAIQLLNQVKRADPTPLPSNVGRIVMSVASMAGLASLEGFGGRLKLHTCLTELCTQSGQIQTLLSDPFLSHLLQRVERLLSGVPQEFSRACGLICLFIWLSAGTQHEQEILPFIPRLSGRLTMEGCIGPCCWALSEILMRGELLPTTVIETLSTLVSETMIERYGTVSRTSLTPHDEKHQVEAYLEVLLGICNSFLKPTYSHNLVHVPQTIFENVYRMASILPEIVPLVGKRIQRNIETVLVQCGRICGPVDACTLLFPMLAAPEPRQRKICSRALGRIIGVFGSQYCLGPLLVEYGGVSNLGLKKSILQALQYYFDHWTTSATWVGSPELRLTDFLAILEGTNSLVTMALAERERTLRIQAIWTVGSLFMACPTIFQVLSVAIHYLNMFFPNVLDRTDEAMPEAVERAMMAIIHLLGSSLVGSYLTPGLLHISTRVRRAYRTIFEACEKQRGAWLWTTLPATPELELTRDAHLKGSCIIQQPLQIISSTKVCTDVLAWSYGEAPTKSVDLFCSDTILRINSL